MATPKTYSAMMKHIALLQHQAEVLRLKEAAGVIKRVQEAMVVYGITPEDLMQAKKSRKVKKAKVPTHPRLKKPKKPVAKKISKRGGKHGPRPAKYADKNGNKWAGGGSMPVWLREQVAQGKNIDDFLVKKTA